MITLASLKSTASIHIPNKRQNHKWSSLSIHNDRRPNSDIKRSNSNINKKQTKLNKYGCLANYYKFMDKPIVWKKLHHKNIVYIKNRHPGKASFKQIPINSDNKQKMIDKYSNKVIGIHTNKRNHHQYLLVDDLHKYLKKLDYKNTRVGIISIGDSKFRDKFEKKLMRQGKSLKQCRRIETRALLQYMEGFNNRNHNLKIGHFAIHNDEKFIHAHVEFYHLARTAKGKPSYSISTAVKSEYPLQPKNNLAMKAFRHKEDNEMIQSLAWSAQIGLRLYRKGHHQDKQTRYNHSLATKYSSVASFVSSKSKPMYSQASSFALSFASSAHSASNSISSASNSISSASSAVNNKFSLASLANFKASSTSSLASSKASSIISSASSSATNIINKAKSYASSIKSNISSFCSNKLDKFKSGINKFKSKWELNHKSKSVSSDVQKGLKHLSPEYNNKIRQGQEARKIQIAKLKRNRGRQL